MDGADLPMPDGGMSGGTPRIDFVIPVYREHPDVLRQTVADIQAAVAGVEGLRHHIIVVNDGSPPEYDYAAIAADPAVTLLHQPVNRGYGSALKQGLRHATAPWVAITDADGTYPNREFGRLIARLDGCDMVIGARITAVRHIPWLRRLPKYALARYASYLAGRRIPDLNSGMRIFRRELALGFWPYFPDGFSMSSTLTMAFLAHGYEVGYEPIDYFKRVGRSAIRPIRDTRLFFQLVGRMGLYFRPLRVFVPIATVLVAVGLLKGVRDYVVEGAVGNVAVSLGIAALQIFLMGLLAQLIVKNR